MFDANYVKKENKVFAVVIVVCAIVSLLIAACAPAKTSEDTKRELQAKSLQEGTRQTGLPAIVNFRELKIVKDLYELRDQDGLVTYTYLWSDMQGKWIFFCDSIGYPIPYATQFTAPESVQTFNITDLAGSYRYYGHEVLPQAEPNGLFLPGNAEGTWVMCTVPGTKTVRPQYVEPRVIATTFRLP